MSLFQRSSCILLVSVASGITSAGAEPAQDFVAVEQAVRQAMPSTKIDSVALAPIPGLVEIVAGQNVLYADTSGRWLVVGHLYDLKTARDVTAERKAQITRIDWQALPLEAAVHYGTGPLKLAVFSDPDCPWCRKLHEALQNAEGIEVWEIMFPVPALHPTARDKAVAILCQAQPAAALAQVMAGQAMDSEPSPAECIEQAQRHIDQAMAFGRAHGIQGTPTLIAADGRVHNGYVPVDQLKAWLEQSNQLEAAE